jgi:hypothetical protein
MSRFNTSKLLIWALFASYLLFGFGGAVIAACCPDAPMEYQARRAIGCQDETCSPVVALHQCTTVPAHKETCLNHCNPARHSRHHLSSGQTTKHHGELHDIVSAVSTSFPQRPLPVDFSTYHSQDNVPQLTLVALRTVVLLI